MLEKDFVLTTSQGGTNFYIGNNPDATGSYTPLKRDRQMPKYEKEDAFQIAMEESGRKLKPSQVSQFWFRKSFTFIKNSPGTFFRLTIKKLLLFFNRQEVEDAINFYYYRNTYWLLSVAFIGFGLIFALGLIGSAIAYKSWKKHSILYIFGIASVVSVVPFYIFSRYRLPVVPVLILFSGNALYHLIKHIKARNYRFITYFFAAFTMILAFSNITVVGTDTSTMHMNIGIAYAEKGQLDEAIANISEAIKLNPNNSNAYKNRGVAYMRKEDFDKAMADFNKAIELNPQNEAAFYSRGLVHMRTGFIDRAIADCNKTIELNPKHALAYNNRGSFYGRKGLLNKAIADLNQSIELDPSLSAAYRNRSIAYKKLGKLDLAKQDEEKAIALQNN